MRLAEFIQENTEPILVEWEKFARHIWPGEAEVSPEELRDEAGDILRSTVADMRTEQSDAQRKQKSRGEEEAAGEDSAFNRASASHGAGRAGSGFDMAAVLAEYRALRASVIRLWRDRVPQSSPTDLEDLTRFNESIDQSLTHAVDAFVREEARRSAAAMVREQDLRAEAEAANRAKDLFLATLSHEMRTPLNAIVGWMSILRSEQRDEQDLAEGLEVIDRSTRAQAKLIDDVLDVSRIISGKLRIRPRSCDLAQVIRDGVEAVRPAAEARAITLDLRLDPKAARARCDPTRIQQIIWNLVSNAVKFTPKGGHVEVTLRREQSSTQIQVSDDGQGIHPQMLPHVFDRFHQADSSTRRKFAGLGLGLSIVKYLVEAHGGIVEAHSAGEGRGSTFTVLLPIQSASVDESREEPPQDRILSRAEADASDADAGAQDAPPLTRLDGLRLLVVDDEPDARRLLARLLGNLGAHVTTAPGAAEALELLGGLEPDVLISDIGMPGMDGLDLIRQVRRRSTSDLPAIALTAYAHRDDADRAVEAGYHVHLTKPVDPGKLTATIARLAGRSTPQPASTGGRSPGPAGA